MPAPSPPLSLLDRLQADRATHIAAGWTLDDHYCLSIRDLTTIIDALRAARSLCSLYEREIRNGFPLTHEELQLTVAMYPLTYTEPANAPAQAIDQPHNRRSID
jgi:hypothetical protein